MTKWVILFSLVILTSSPGSAQNMQPDRLAVTAVVQKMFDAMSQNDTTNLSSLFTQNAVIETVVSENNEPYKKEEKATVFIQNVGKPHPQKWGERAGDYHLAISGSYAVCFMDFAFYLNDSLHHCGINNFEFLKSGDGWKINKITVTRQATGCSEIPANSIYAREKLKYDTLSVNDFLNNWHLAAAKADEEVFFDAMDENGIYIGTDATECWSRQAFYDWAIKYFQRESAWDFKPTSRNIYFSTDGSTAWFNELLDTWMGVCRGSGTIHLETTGWKINQYHLAVTVPNNRIKEFIELVK